MPVKGREREESQEEIKGEERKIVMNGMEYEEET